MHTYRNTNSKNSCLGNLTQILNIQRIVSFRVWMSRQAVPQISWTAKPQQTTHATSQSTSEEWWTTVLTTMHNSPHSKSSTHNHSSTPSSPPCTTSNPNLHHFHVQQQQLHTEFSSWSVATSMHCAPITYWHNCWNICKYRTSSWESPPCNNHSTNSNNNSHFHRHHRQK